VPKHRGRRRGGAKDDLAQERVRFDNHCRVGADYREMELARARRH